MLALRVKEVSADVAPILSVTPRVPAPDLTTRLEVVALFASSLIVEPKLIFPSMVVPVTSESTVTSSTSTTAPEKVIPAASPVTPVALYIPSKLMVPPVILMSLISLTSVAPLAPIPSTVTVAAAASKVTSAAVLVEGLPVSAPIISP